MTDVGSYQHVGSYFIESYQHDEQITNIMISDLTFDTHFSLSVAVIISIMAIIGSIALSRSRYSSPDDQTSSTSTPNLERNEQNRIREVRLKSTDTIESII